MEVGVRIPTVTCARVETHALHKDAGSSLAERVTVLFERALSGGAAS